MRFGGMIIRNNVAKIVSAVFLLAVGIRFLLSSLTTPANVLIQQLDTSRFVSSSPFKPHSPLSKASFIFWSDFANVLAKGKPSFPEVRRKGNGELWVAFDRQNHNQLRHDRIDLQDEEFLELRDLRDEAVEEFKQLANNLPYEGGSRGIVTTAHPNAFGILTTSLWMLRASGSQLPVEIWLYDQAQYEAEPCDVIFPALNAKCMFMVDQLPPNLDQALHIVKFTYKPLAMMFSTFEQFLFIDDDVFPVINPDAVFDSEPFTSHGALLWPDYWADTTSQELYNISYIPVPNMDKRASTESGSIFFDKSTHAPALLLATWFNQYGPEYWHRLASQGAAGEGDKDLWRFAIDAFELPWYQVEERPQRVGYSCNGKGWPVGTAQSHPLDDFTIKSASTIRDKEDMLSLGTSRHPRILFIHANLPKLDPYLLLDWGRLTPGWHDVLRCDNGTGEVHRLYGVADLTIPKYGWDMEKAIWNSFVWQTCLHPRGYKVWIEWSYWRPKPRNDLCTVFSALWKEHFPRQKWSRTVPDPATPLAPDIPWGFVKM